MISKERKLDSSSVKLLEITWTLRPPAAFEGKAFVYLLGRATKLWPGKNIYL